VDIPLENDLLRERFLSYVDEETGEWNGWRDRDGDGIFTWTGPSGERVKWRAHRVARLLVVSAPSARARLTCAVVRRLVTRCGTDATVVLNPAVKPARSTGSGSRSILA